jgi:hypothetical protein
LKSLNKTKPGRVEKTKSITISGLTEALKLVKNLSSGKEAGSSGLQNKIQDPVVAKLLDFVKDIKQEGTSTSAVETSSVVKAPGKNAIRNERRRANRAKRDAEAAQTSSSMEVYQTSTGTLPPPPPLAPSGEVPPPLASSRTRTESEIERDRLLESDDEIDAGNHGTTPVNTSQDVSDLMDLTDAPVHPSQVESLADSVQRVAVQDQESEQRLSADP